MFGWQEKVRRENKVRESIRREKYVRNRVDLMYSLVEEKDKRNRRDRNVFIFEMT